MSAKTYDRQSGKFIERVAENLPEMSDEIMQGWIDNPKMLQEFLEGLCPSIQITGEHIIDCDAIPFDPGGRTIESHKKGGKITWDPSRFKLWLHPEQEMGRFIDRHEWFEWMKNKPVYNACMLDYWMVHLEVIPPECKGKVIGFPGTVYASSCGSLSVRCLFWSGVCPPFSYFLDLDSDWGVGVDGPAAGSVS